METPVILSAVRTPIGKFQGGLSSFSAIDLGAKAIAEAIRRSGLDAKQVDEAILGNVVQAGLGQNPARQAALKGGCDPRVAAMTINKVCGSGLKAVALAAQAVQLGESEIVVAGGILLIHPGKPNAVPEAKQQPASTVPRPEETILAKQAAPAVATLLNPPPTVAPDQLARFAPPPPTVAPGAAAASLVHLRMVNCALLQLMTSQCMGCWLSSPQISHR